MSDSLAKFQELPPSCPAENTCHATIPEGSPCGDALDDLPPELLAEQLCPWAIAGAIAAEQRRTIEPGSNYSRRAAGHQFRLGSLYFDLAISQMREPSAFDAHMATAEGHLEASAQRTGHATAINASCLKAYIPFARLRNFRPVPGDQILQLQNSLLDVADNASDRFSTVTKTRVGLHLLYARQGRLAFPATAREHAYEGGEESPRQHSLSHGAYTIDDTCRRKIPHRLENYTSRTSMRSMVHAHLGSITRRAIGDIAGGSLPDAREAMNLAFDWLYDDAAGHRLDTQTLRILNTMADFLDKERRLFIRKNPM